MALIQIDDPSLTENLVRFMRERECVAVLRGAVKVQVVPSKSVNEDDETTAVRKLLVEWCSLHPAARAGIVRE